MIKNVPIITEYTPDWAELRNVNRNLYNLSTYNLKLFPFYVYDKIEESITQNVNSLGNNTKKKNYQSYEMPYSKFSVTIKFSTLAERIFIKNWFSNVVVGKKNLFYFPTSIPNFNIISVEHFDAEDGYYYLRLKSTNYFKINPLGKLLIEEKNYLTTYRYNEELSDDEFDILQLGTTINFNRYDYICNIQILKPVRLDTDTLTFELEDINICTVKLSLVSIPLFTE